MLLYGFKVCGFRIIWGLGMSEVSAIFTSSPNKLMSTGKRLGFLGLGPKLSTLHAKPQTLTVKASLYRSLDRSLYIDPFLEPLKDPFVEPVKDP